MSTTKLRLAAVCSILGAVEGEGEDEGEDEGDTFAISKNMVNHWRCHSIAIALPYFMGKKREAGQQ